MAAAWASETLVTNHITIRRWRQFDALQHHTVSQAKSHVMDIHRLENLVSHLVKIRGSIQKFPD
jgi:hypothetical protein